MGILTHKTTILLSPEEHRVLLREARKKNATMGEVVRLAIHKAYTPTRKAGAKAWEKLFKSRAPVSDWEEMENEILKGRLGS
ncbi:MAG: hypothetical protein Q7T11_07485 [Deltaproteobacteria bacterium]|nr:hypothetical protein [Deltaproteobacteria bacterium]